MTNNKQPRSRNFSIVTYLSRETLETYCKQPHIKNYAFIYHDRDVKEDGTPKEAHFHLVVVYNNTRTLSAVKSEMKTFSNDGNTLVEYCNELEATYDYLLHRRNPEKAQYTIDEVTTNVGYFRGDYSSSEDNTAYCLVMDIIAGKSRLELLRKYGRDYAINRAQYYGLATEIMQEEEYEHPDNETLLDAQQKARRSKHKPMLILCNDDGGLVRWEDL